MKVVIAGNFWFPHGTASAARIRNLALGLRDCGARVHVITMAPHPRRHEGAEEHEGISYECTSPTVAAVDGWRDADRTVPRLRQGLGAKVRWFAGLYGATPFALRSVARRIREHGCGLLVAYDRSAIRMTPLAGLCRRRGVPSVLDVSEASEHLGGSRLSAVYWDSVLGTHATPRLFDGVTAITTGLAAWFRARGCAQTLVLPAMEAWPPSPPPVPTGNAVFRLTYVGALQARDAPECLFDAAWHAARQGLALALDVIGHYQGTERGLRLASRCASDPVLSRVVRFLGTVSDSELATRLAASDALILTRRAARTEELSFPTRLVEYLRYGRPVLVSDVGDVSRYLEDAREVALLPPSDPRGAARVIAAVACRPDRGAAIGLRGREAGGRAFDRRTHAARLLEFAGTLRPSMHP